MSQDERGAAAQIDVEWLRLALDQVSARVSIRDAEGRYLYANQALLQRIGCRPGALIGQTDERFLSPAEAERRRHADRQVLAGKRLVETLTLSDPHGAQRSVQETRLPLRAPDASTGDPPSAVLCVEEELVAGLPELPTDGQSALLDALTGLPNQRLLIERLGQAQQRSRRSGSFGALLCLELDQYAAIGGQHGRAAAERLVVEASRRLGQSVRSVDTVARVGECGFVVLAESVGLDQSQGIDFSAELKSRIERLFAEGCNFGGLSLEFSARMGSVLFRGTEPGAHDLLEAATEVMQQSRSG